MLGFRAQALSQSTAHLTSKGASSLGLRWLCPLKSPSGRQKDEYNFQNRKQVNCYDRMKAGYCQFFKAVKLKMKGKIQGCEHGMLPYGQHALPRT